MLSYLGLHTDTFWHLTPVQRATYDQDWWSIKLDPEKTHQVVAPGPLCPLPKSSHIFITISARAA